jgi:RNA polymerase sigma-70 factor (ECF subfamily)
VDDVTALALAARDGDRVALSDFIRRTWAGVGRLAAALAGPALAEDVAQDTYVRALRALPAYRADSAARTWLLSIARRAAVDAVRGAARRRRLSRLLAGGAGGRRRRPRAPGRRGAHPPGAVPARPRPAHGVRADQLMGFDYASAAEVCGCPVGTVRSRVARARSQLVAELGLVDVGRSDPVAEPDEPPVRP